MDIKQLPKQCSVFVLISHFGRFIENTIEEFAITTFGRMDFVNDIRDSTLNAASAIGYAAKGVGEQLSAVAGEIGDQMHILGSNVGHGLSVAAGDIGNSMASIAGNISHSVSSILAKAFNDFVRLVNACETHEVSFSVKFLIEQEEDIVIQAELGHLKKKFREKDLRGVRSCCCS